MKRLDIETWKVIFKNAEEKNEEVEVVWLDEVGTDGEWSLCIDCELFEDGFKTEAEATKRLEYLMDICNNNENVIPLGKAKDIYFKLRELYINGNRQLEDYINIARTYAQLKSKYGSLTYGINQVYTLNGKEYTMRNSFNDGFFYMMLAEDLTMMVYRLYGGKDYNTYSLIEAIERLK